MADKRYMELLDEWTEQTVLKPLDEAFSDWTETEDDSEEEKEMEGRMMAVEHEVKKAIREKVLQSYRNGQAAGKPAVRQKQTEK